MVQTDKQEKIKDSFLANAKRFLEDLPYKKVPYSGRNWGHSLHSLCSYHGKLKPAIAHFLIKEFTSAGDVVVDPLSGVGTIPLEACLQGRIGIGNDLSPLAFIVTKSKTENPTLKQCLDALNKLNSYIERTKNTSKIQKTFAKYKNFGFNGKLPDYFHPDTFKEILCAREYFVPQIQDISSANAMLYSCLLHVLHGNRPYALSRNSHPLTPYAPTGPCVYKNVIEHIKNKLLLSYNNQNLRDYIQGQAFYGDFGLLSRKNILADIVITSPPFADSMRFYMQNWMRLWLCGWELDDYKQAEEIFLDRKQKDNFDIYLPFFKMCSDILRPGGKIILHLGRTSKIDMAEELSMRANSFFSEVYRGNENVQNIEKHGIKDKGNTIEHQYLFLIKK